MTHMMGKLRELRLVAACAGQSPHAEMAHRKGCDAYADPIGKRKLTNFQSVGKSRVWRSDNFSDS